MATITVTVDVPEASPLGVALKAHSVVKIDRAFLVGTCAEEGAVVHFNVTADTVDPAKVTVAL